MRSVENSVLTHSGIYFDLSAPRAEDVSILDIARALSRICRYTGHTSTHYSVAEHSVRASHLVDPQHALAALIHDAAEAYVGDVSWPLKQMLPAYQTIERQVQIAVFTAFDLPRYLPEQVRAADRYMLAWERRDLMCEHAVAWPACAGIVVSDAPRLDPWPADEAMKRFLDRFHALTGADVYAEEAVACAA